jgi:hypothetical protein
VKEVTKEALSKEQLSRMDEILSHVRSLDAQMTWVIRSEAKELEPLLLSFFKKRRIAAKVYLAVNGIRTSGQIAAYLSNIYLKDILVQAVSRELTELENRGLVELKEWSIYKKSKIDSILRLSSALRKDSLLKDIK